jgi:hypothetical protein
VRFHVRGIDHLRICGSSVPGELPEQVFPDAAPSPAHKAVIDRCRRTILRRAIAPTTAALQYMHDAADNSAIVRPLDAPDIRRQVRLDPLPLLIAQPKQVVAHDPNPLPKTNQDRIVRAEKLMSSDPSIADQARSCPDAELSEIIPHCTEFGPVSAVEQQQSVHSYTDHLIRHAASRRQKFLRKSMMMSITPRRAARNSCANR